MSRILLVRHGQSTWNAKGRWQGRADPPLSDAGRAQAGAAADRLLQFGGLTAAVSSDQQRASATADLIAARLGWPAAERFPGLRERDVGAFTGLTRAEIVERFSDAALTHPTDPPGAETRPALVARAMATLHRIAEAHDGAEVLAVTHGALIRAVEAALDVPGSGPPNHLSGRWITLGPAGPAPGEAVSLLELLSPI